MNYLPIAAIQPNPDQPREHFNPEKLQTLAASIKVHGVLMPLVVYQSQQGWVLIAGERRLRASSLAGLTDVPVRVIPEPSQVERLELALIENLQREDLDPIEEAHSYQQLMRTHGYTQEQIATKVGFDRTTITNSLRLLRLPPTAQEAIQSAQISAGHGRALLSVENPDRQKELLQEIITEGLSVRETERRARRSPQSAAPKDRGLQRLNDSLSQQLAARVQILPKKDGGGRIVIGYESAEELNRLSDLLLKEA